MKKIRILIADDHAFLRMGLKSYITGKKDLACVGEADDGRKAVETALRLKPDVVVMDLMMPELNGAEATRRIRAALPDTKVVVLTSFGTSAELAAAISNGAAGAVFKDAHTENLIAAIRKAAAGEPLPPVSPVEIHGDDGRPKLSPRQREMLSAITSGQSNADIGRKFGISGETVKKHLSIVFAKLGASNRAEAVALALRQGLVSVSSPF